MVSLGCPKALVDSERILTRLKAEGYIISPSFEDADDKVDNDGAICRTKADAPEIDGNLFVDSNFNNLKPGDFCKVLVEDYSEYDLWGKII